jgi:hypothetical protein
MGVSEEKSKGIIKKYETEIQEIKYILENLKLGRITEISGAKMDGYLATNATKLEEEITKLLVKIDRELPSTSDDLSDIF